LEELAKELSQPEEGEKEKDKEPLLNHTKTSDIQNILSDMETLTDEFCDNDHDWEQ
jgi:predicted transcriptional regulator